MTGKGRKLELSGVGKHYGPAVAVEEISFTIEPGNFVSLLGPSGCGKTTTLRMIAGFEVPSWGNILLDGKPIHTIPIHRRDIGVVFQDHALFPHRTVAQNIAFGLVQRGVSKREVAERVAWALATVRLPDLGARYPSELSGGQRQRVAIARAIVIEPDLLLFDEPLSALDATLREDLRNEIKRLQRKLGISTLFVTHDQAEALSLSDHIVVMNAGRIEQQGSPEDIYRRPRSAFVARFFGELNQLTAAVVSSKGGELQLRLGCGTEIRLRSDQPVTGEATLCLRSEAARIDSDPYAGGLPARVMAFDYLGMMVRYQLAACGGEVVIVQPHAGTLHQPGSDVRLHIAEGGWKLLDTGGDIHGY